jgi:hypothetical protein
MKHIEIFETYSGGRETSIILLAKHIKGERKMENKDWEDLIRETGGIVDSRGQWDHPGECTMIPSNFITMKNVPYKVLGIDDLGNSIMMEQEKEYFFPGKFVFEIPLFGKGKEIIEELKKNLSK